MAKVELGGTIRVKSRALHGADDGTAAKAREIAVALARASQMHLTKAKQLAEAAAHSQRLADQRLADEIKDKE